MGLVVTLNKIPTGQLDVETKLPIIAQAGLADRVCNRPHVIFNIVCVRFFRFYSPRPAPWAEGQDCTDAQFNFPETVLAFRPARILQHRRRCAQAIQPIKNKSTMERARDRYGPRKMADLIIIKRMDALIDMASERKALRCELDALSDVVVNVSSVSFRREIRTLRAHETFCETPRDVMERTASLLEADIIDGVARTVHDTVTVAIGCNRVPLFALVEGGRARTLFTFRCVYDGCPAFMDIRTFVGQWRVKWIIVCISHLHSKGKELIGLKSQQKDA